MNNYYPHYVNDRPNITTSYYYDKLFRLLYTLFDFDNLPNNWDSGYIKYVIFNYGFIGIFKKTSIGAIPLYCGIGGYNYMYRPSVLRFANWAVGDGEGVIGKDCEMVYTNYMLTPIAVTASYYSEILANIDASIKTNLYNTRLSTVFYANNDAEKQTLYSLIDAVSMGNPAVVVSKKYEENIRNRIVDLNNCKSTYIGDLLNELYRNIINRYLTDIGINNIAFEKNERLVASEATSNDVEINLIHNDMIANLKSCFNRVNNMLGTDIAVKSNIERVKEYVQETNILSDNTNGNARIT